MKYEYIADLNVESPGDDLISFKRYLTDRCGLYFKDSDRKTLMDAISKRMSACALRDTREYFRYLTDSRQREEEFRNLLNLLTVHHTFFFRNGPHFHVFKEKILPEIIEKKKENPMSARPAIRVWSAGCSTGEEPYTIAMIMRDAVPDLDKWEIEIHATDVSTEAVEKARTAVYRTNSIKHMDVQYLNRYFVKLPGQEGCYAIQEPLKRMVRFEYHNLLTDRIPSGYDVIFCRNVFIYFQLERMLEVVNRLHSSLADPGYLFLGHSESLQFLTTDFQMESWEGGVYYRKRTGERDERDSTVHSFGRNRVAVEDILGDISREELKAERKFKGKESEVISQSLDQRLVQIMKWIHLKEYDRALSLIEKSGENGETVVELRYLRAEIHANRNEFDKAVDTLLTIQVDEPFFAPTHYLLGSIFLEKEELEQAKVSLKKALYLDGDFAIARFLLGVVHKTQGKKEQALREFRNTLRCLESRSHGDVVAYSGGFNAGTLAAVCRENIDRLSSEL